MREIVKIYFESLKNLVRFLINLILNVSKHFVCLNTISLIYTSLFHNLVKYLTGFIDQTFNRGGLLHSVCNENSAIFTSEQPNRYTMWSFQRVCDALYYLLDNIFIKFGLKLF